MATRREWAKIQGRFGDVAFIQSSEEMIRLVAQAIGWNREGVDARLAERIDRAISTAVDVGAVPPGMSEQEFRKSAWASYPLHPLALVALPYLFRRFAQNERSLFSGLTSLEPFGFQEFIRTRPLVTEAPEFVRLPDLFDYFTKNFGLGLYRQPQALRWLEAADALERKDRLGEFHRKVVKSVGILNALGQFSHLTASPAMISADLRNSATPEKVLESVFSDLRAESILTFRKYNRSYQIWEGSDVDIEERIAEGQRKTQALLGLGDSVREYLPNRPMVARRHSFETGALRALEVVYVDALDGLESAIEARTAAEGSVLVCLAESPSLAGEFEARAKQARKESRILFAIPQEIGGLRGAVTELGALRWVWKNTPELRDDRVARREISLRITEAEQLLRRSLKGLVRSPAGTGRQ